MPSDAKLDDELPDVALRKAHWDGKQIDAETIEFTRPLPKVGLEAVKRYRIAKIEAGKPAYHLTLEVELRNTGKAARQIAYQLDGPTGLPTEGWWFASRISPEWGGAGVRNTVLMMQGKPATLMSPMQIGDNKLDPPFRWEDAESLLTYAGVDAQYFACALMPNPQTNREPWLAQIKPILAGSMPTERVYRTLGNVTCRLISTQAVIEPKGKLVHTYTVFAGPKQPDLLAQYPLDATPGNNLGELIYYGWPMWAMVARLMTHVLHFFYSIVGNYGIAIIMLTVLVRGCMFPLSRKQALGAQKMQLLKPEMDRINEKYKGKNEEKARAMQELYRKHGFNPMSGCMLAVVQLPIFMGLYRSLMINVELRQAPLIERSDSLVLESGGARHVVPLGRLVGDAEFPDRLQRLHVAGAVSEYPADFHRGTDDFAAANVHAAGHRRADADAAEDDEVHDDFDRLCLLHRAQRIVFVHHLVQPVGHRRKETAAQNHQNQWRSRSPQLAP